MGTAATENAQEEAARESIDDIADADFDDDVADELGHYALVEGDCFDNNSELPSTPTDVVDALVEEVPCSSPHDAEVVGVLAHPDPPGTAYPGSEAIIAYANTQCLPFFEPFVGIAIDFSSLDIAYFFPLDASWQRLDDRRIVCSVYALDGSPLTGTMRGSGR